MDKPTCHACGDKPARRLKCTRTHYANARENDPIFCSRVCAADFGLLSVGVEIEGTPSWKGGEWTNE